MLNDIHYMQRMAIQNLALFPSTYIISGAMCDMDIFSVSTILDDN